MEDSEYESSFDIPPASETSLQVPTYRYSIGRPSMAPAHSPALMMSPRDLTNTMAPALAPIAVIVENVRTSGFLQS